MKFELQLKEKVWRKATVIVEVESEEELEEKLDAGMDFSEAKWIDTWGDLEVVRKERIE